MGYSKLKIPKICEFCGKPFEAKTVTTRFCSKECGHKADNARKKEKRLQEQRETLLQSKINEIAELQARPYISISEAVTLFGISRSTIRRLIMSGKIPAANLGLRLTRIDKKAMEAMFTAIEIPEAKEEKLQPISFNIKDCYTIGEITEKFGISASTVDKTIRKNSIPKRQIGKYVYVPKSEIDKLFK